MVYGFGFGVWGLGFEVYGFDEAVLDLPGHAIGAPLAADEEAKQ